MTLFSFSDIGFENNLDTYGIVAGLFNAVFSIG